MPRPAVLIVDPESARRRELARGLAQSGYEVVPAVDEAEGRRFAEGLGPAVVVAPLGLAGFGDAAGIARLGAGEPGAGRTLLILGAGEGPGSDLPEQVLYLPADGLPASELVRRVRLVLLGREVGVEPDAALESLVGDLAEVPVLELLRALHRAGFGGRVRFDAGAGGGEIAFDGGEVVAAAAGTSRGVKAFCRLGRAEQGQVRLLPGPFAGEREIERGLPDLVILAIEDVVHGAPDPRCRVRVEVGPAFFDTPFTPSQRELLAALARASTVGALVDALAERTDGEVLRDLLALRDAGAVAWEEPEARVRVVTDSTADLPAELARAHGIQVVPLAVRFDDRVFRDGVDLRPREFYERLETGAGPPSTSPPGRADFLEAYGALLGRHDVVSVHLSGKLSETLANAAAAAEEGRRVFRGLRPDGEPEAVAVDSGSVSLGLGLLALCAARMAARGSAAGAIRGRLEAMRERLHVLFVVDTLDYLVRGGRVGKARGLAGKLLGIKPILGVAAGEVVPVDRVRGGREAHPRIVELLRARVDPERPGMAGIAHAKAPVWADRLRTLLEQSFRISELVVAEMGPVVGAHAGPGTVGVAFLQPTDDELPLVAPIPQDAG